MTVGKDIYTSTIALQAPVEEGVELAGVIEDDLARKGQVLVSRVLLTME